MVSRIGWACLLAFGVWVNVASAQNENGREIPPEWLEKYPGIRRMGELKVKPKTVKRADVAFPDSLREREIRGTVRVAAVIDTEGKLVDSRVIESEFPELAEIALDTLRQWEFVPGMDKGKAVISQFVGRVQLGGNDEFDEPPIPRSQTKPVYPLNMRMLGHSGRVLVGMIVNKEGRVEAAHALESSHPAFRHAAVDAVERWRFHPAKKDGKPTAVSITIPILFSVEGEPSSSRGWTITRPKKWPPNFPESMQWDKAPALLTFNPPVYPRDALLGKIKGKVRVQFLIDPLGDVAAAKVMDAPSAEIGAAAVAAVETFKFKPARRNGQPCGAVLTMDFDFNTSRSSSAPFTSESSRVLGLLRKESDKIVNSTELDREPRALLTKMPLAPLVHRKSQEAGMARIEFILSRRGTVELAHVLEATSPEYGYAAIQAMSEWQFEPPRRDGKVVDTRLILPLIFEKE